MTDEMRRDGPSRLRGRPRPPLNAYRMYLVLSAGTAFLLSCIFSVNLVYHATVVALEPLQLVLVGTILEGTVFLFEIPTGIVADLKSRRLSIVIGYVLMGAGFILEGAVPRFAAVAACQVLWGLGYTFTSGATEAWIVDEIGDERAAEAFVRAAQAGRVGGLLAIPVGVALGTITVGLPIVLGGVALLLMALFLAVAMPETGFHPARADERATWAALAATLRDARAVGRRQPMLLLLLGIGFFYGLYSEGFDRLTTIHILQDVPMPQAIAALEPVILFGIIGAISSTVSLGATELMRRRVDLSNATTVGRVLATTGAAIVLALVGFGLARRQWLALGLLWLIDAARAITGPLLDVWFNRRIDDASVRATLFSVRGQVDAIGQVAGGPVIGVVGQAVSVSVALVGSALLLAPALPLYALALRRDVPVAAVEKAACGCVSR